MRRELCFIALSLLSACVPKTGRLEANRFQHKTYPYAVFYAKGGSPEAPLGPDFQVDNFATIDGRTYEPKVTPEYVVDRQYDLGADGRGDFVRSEPRYDLLLVQRGGDAALWVRTIPLSFEASQASLEHLAEQYAAAMGAQKQVAPDFGPERIAPLEPSSVRIEDRRACALSERPAQRLDFEVPTLATRPGGAPGSKRASIVAVRTGYETLVSDGPHAAKYPVLMIIGAAAGDLTRVEGVFDQLLTQTVLGDVGLGLSMQGKTSCGSGDTTAGGAIDVQPSDVPPSQQAPAQAAPQPPTSAPAAGPNLRPEDVLQPMPPEEP